MPADFGGRLFDAFDDRFACRGTRRGDSRRVRSGYAGSSAAQPTSGKIRPAPAFPARELVAPPTSGWPTNGGSLYNQRYSPLTRINRGNVANLKPIWRVSLNGSASPANTPGEAQPIVHDGVIYVVTGADDVFAVDVETAQILWTYQAKLDERSTPCAAAG